MVIAKSDEIHRAEARELSLTMRRVLGLAQRGRVLMYPIGGALLLVPEDPTIRALVERNERLLAKRGMTVDDVQRALRTERRARATRHAKPRAR